ARRPAFGQVVGDDLGDGGGGVAAIELFPQLPELAVELDPRHRVFEQAPQLAGDVGGGHAALGELFHQLAAGDEVDQSDVRAFHQAFQNDVGEEGHAIDDHHRAGEQPRL